MNCPKEGRRCEGYSQQKMKEDREYDREQEREMRKNGESFCCGDRMY